jgi:hypothetical protein
VGSRAKEQEPYREAKKRPAVPERSQAPVRQGAGDAAAALSLQRKAGNRATTALLAAGQAKLTVSAAGDRYEQEADAVAAQVLARLQRGPVPGAGAPVGDPSAGTAALAAGLDDEEAPLGRALSPESDEEAPVGRALSVLGRRAPVGAEGGDLGPETEGRIESARSGGSALPGPVRSAMEGAFGADFGSVKLHKGREAGSLNDDVGAVAFTVGSDIFLGRSSPEISSAAGQSLLAHELAHTIQQGGARLRDEAGQA